jgi:signal transduction histidine kinase
VTTLTRPPIESMRPVISFAGVRLLLAVGALLADMILGFPYNGALAAILAFVAIPWSVVVLILARRDPASALTPFVAAGDLAVLVIIEATVPETYAPVRFAALLFIGAHAHFQGQRVGLILAGGGAAALIAVGVGREGPVSGNTLAFYETVFAVTALAMAAVIGELRGFETAGRLRARELSRRTLVGEDEVRRRVADFIHDGPVQDLIGLDLLLKGAATAAERGNTERTGELLSRARELAESNVSLLRDEIVNLGPYAFEELSFEIAVERCIPIWRRRYECTVTVDADVDLEPAVANDLFRITQEAVANGCKHGHADHVHVSLDREDGLAELRVIDNGKGFSEVDPLASYRPGHIGLASMRERADMLDGKLNIESEPGRTVVRVRVPIGGLQRRNRR